MESNTPEQIVASAYDLLVQQHGARKWQRPGDAMAVLVRTVLSQTTNQANTEAAYKKLRQRYPTWDSVADAPYNVVSRVIHVGGLAMQKAQCISGVLRGLRSKRGKIDLDFLADMPLEKARKTLLAFEGVGPKTADCVLLFAYNMPAFPVDTHVHCMAKRLGLVRRGSSVEQAHEILTPLIPPPQRYAMHVLMVEHGRQVCRLVRPLCPNCRLMEMCRFGQRQFPPPRQRRSPQGQVRSKASLQRVRKGRRVRRSTAAK
jgi:endonuclease III